MKEVAPTDFSRLGYWSSFALVGVVVAYWIALAALAFAALAFDGAGRGRAASRGLVVCGILCLAGTIGPAVGNMRLQHMGVFGYAVALPVTSYLLARAFAEAKTPRT